MNTSFKAGKTRQLLALLAGCLSTAFVHAAPGSYWEITSKMEMPGMPIAMPAMSIKVCIPNGGEKNPQYMQKKDGKCQLSDVKTTGNKVSWKATCVENGETMTGIGEVSHGKDSFQGTMRLQGSTHGQAVNMSQNYSGKKIGGTCDSEDQVREIKKMADSLCDTSRFGATDWIARASQFLQGNSCPGKKEALCTAVRRDAARDANAYQLLLETEKHNNALIITSCGLNLEATRASVCKANKNGNYEFLKANCPAEAKAYKEDSRKKNCEGRSYTARNSAECRGGADNDDRTPEAVGSHTDRTQAPAAPAGNNTETGKLIDAIPSTGNANTDAVIEGAKKLKGLFGF